MSPNGCFMSNKRFLNTNTVSGILSLVFAIFLIVFIPFQVPTGALGNSSKILPYALAGIFLLCGIGLILEGVFLSLGKQIIITKTTMKSAISYIVYGLMFVLYAILLRYVGFIISSFFIATVILLNYKIKRLKQYVIVYLFIILINWVFINFVKISLPKLF
jgi:hypothetical protein